MIIIEIKKALKCPGEYSLFITFNYNPDIVDIMREQSIRFWNPDLKCWEVPLKSLDKLKTDLQHFTYKIIDTNNILKKLEELNSIESFIPDNYTFKLQPFSYQLEGINYGLKYDKFLLGDEQGLGKTMQVINIACIKKQLKNYKHCLIVCGVNGLKWNWKAEVEKHSDEYGYILGTRYKKDGKEYIGTMADRLDDLDELLQPLPKNIGNLNEYDPYFLITNIETLRNEKIIEKLKLLCDNNIINMIALDEGHKCKDPTSIQGKALLKLQAETMISMTGTPLMNTPLDLYIHLRWLGYEKHSFYPFKQHYCVFGGFGGYQVVGYKNLDQLKEQLDDIMLRRLKKDVLDLPDKIYITEYVEMSPKQSKIYKEVKAEITENIDRVLKAVNPLTEMIRLRQATGYTGILSSEITESAKFDRLDELIDEAVSNNDKVIVFSNWTDITNPTFDRLKKYNPAIITGETKNRVEQESKFMTDNTCKVIVGTVGAMGTGLTLTAASTVIFLDEPWTKATKL